MTVKSKPKTTDAICLALESQIKQLNNDVDAKQKNIERWQQAFDASPDLISILDVHHRIMMVNRAMTTAMGCSSQQAHGKHCYRELHGTEKPPLGCPHSQLLEDGKAHQSEIYEERLNMWLLVTVTPLYDAGGHVTGSIHIARDITRLKQVEQQLRESEERYRQLADATLEGVLLSEGSIILAANRALAEMFGYSVKTLNGLNLAQFVAAHDRDRMVQAIQEPQEETHQLEGIKRDGTVFPIQAHTRLVTLNGRTVLQTAIRDLTEQKKIEQERIAHDRLQGVLEMAGAVCHELNQPLTALYGYAELMNMKTMRNYPAIQEMEKIMQQLNRVRTITNKLMHITKYETKDYVGSEKIIDIDLAAPEKD